MKVGNRPSTRSRHGFTLSAEQLMEEAARKEMGTRIRELRERSPYRQQHMADQLNIGLRMYQRLEERGTTDWERAQEIGKIHGVDPHWIWDGEQQPETPDLIGQMNGRSQLDRIEEQLTRIIAAQGRIEETQAYFLSVIEAGQAETEQAELDADRGRAPVGEQASRAATATDN